MRTSRDKDLLVLLLVGYQRYYEEETTDRDPVDGEGRGSLSLILEGRPAGFYKSFLGSFGILSIDPIYCH